jgi:hypothetical protein
MVAQHFNPGQFVMVARRFELAALLNLDFEASQPIRRQSHDLRGSALRLHRKKSIDLLLRWRSTFLM